MIAIIAGLAIEFVRRGMCVATENASFLVQVISRSALGVVSISRPIGCIVGSAEKRVECVRCVQIAVVHLLVEKVVQIARGIVWICNRIGGIAGSVIAFVRRDTSVRLDAARFPVNEV